MVIINPTVPNQPAAVNRPAGPAPVIPTDRVMTVTVMGQRAEHLYELASGNLKMTAESQTPLRNGEQLQLQFAGRDAQQRLLLRVLATPPEALAQQLRQTLPQQRPMNLALSSMTALLQTGGSTPQTDAARDFLAQLPRPETLSEAGGLRQQLLHSGLFLENQLARGSLPTAEGDLKTALLRLAERLNQQAQQQAQSPANPGGKVAPLAEYSRALVQASVAKAQLAPNLSGGGQTAATTAPGGQILTPVTGQNAGAAILPQPTGTTQPPANAPPSASPPGNPAPGAGSAQSNSGTLTTGVNPSPASALPGTGTPGSVLSATRPPATTTTEVIAQQPRRGYRQAVIDTELPGVAKAHPRLTAQLSDGNTASLLEQVRGAIARLESHQLLHLQNRELLHGQTFIELPVRDKDGVDLWQFQLQYTEQNREQHSGEQAKDQSTAPQRLWSINLNFDLPGLGPIQARVSCQNEQVDMKMSIAQPATLTLFNAHLQDLRDRLLAQGLENPSLELHLGQPASEAPPGLLSRSFIEDSA